MADDTAQDVVEDVQADVQNEVDTSTNDAQDTDIELEDIEVDLDDDGEEDTDEPDSEETPASESEEESEEDVEETQPETKEKATLSEEEQKRHNAEMAQKRIADKQAREGELKNAQAEFLQDARDDNELALKQLQIDAYNNRVDFNKSKLETGIDKAVAGIDLFKNGSQEQKEYLLSSLDEFERMYVSYDQWGNPVDVKGNVETFLQERAETARRLAGVGARNQNKAKSDQKARTLTPPSKAPKEPKVDSDLEDFDKAWG